MTDSVIPFRGRHGEDVSAPKKTPRECLIEALEDANDLRDVMVLGIGRDFELRSWNSEITHGEAALILLAEQHRLAQEMIE